MAGKGSKRRPMHIAYTTYDTNWDKIFNKEKKDLAYESDNPLERPYDYKQKQQELTELNADGNEDRGRNGEDLSK